MARRATQAAPSVAGQLVGRTDELAILLSAVEHGPQIVFVHGIAGIGKSTLLAAFAGQARTRDTHVVHLDCGAVEPTERGFLHELGAAVGGSIATAANAAYRLGSIGSRVVLTLDTYEVFRLLDTWLRRELLPRLPPNVSLVIAGRDRPVSAWFLAASHTGLPRNMTLGPLLEADALTLLEQGGVEARRAGRINRFAAGHPLALRLATVAASDWSSADTDAIPPAAHVVVEELTRMYLEDVTEPTTKRALDAASVVRRTTVSLLRAMLPDIEPNDAFERLRELPFVEIERDGLHVHDLVRQAIALSLRAADPSRYEDYRRAACRQLTTELRKASTSHLWRYTADLLYIIENPILRGAFFPDGAPFYIVEPARAVDAAAIREIAELHEGPAAAGVLQSYWKSQPESFHVVRDEAGRVAGFYQMFEPPRSATPDIDADPIARGWHRHLRSEPLPSGQRALFLRRWLGRETGEAPSPVQAACWLDIKRVYMEMRPHLRRVYLSVRDLDTYGPAACQLGFKTLPELDVSLDGETFHSALLDLGPSSVDGWLAQQLATELGVADDDILDAAAHELVLEGRRVALTPLEYSVIAYLQQNEGKPVSRASLIENVWGYSHVGSNVVETVVRSLRKKLGERASAIETVRGVGYRFRRP